MAAKTASLSINIIADAAKARAGLKEAETAFGKFRREIDESQGAMGKFRTVSGSAFDYVKQNAIGFASAAGAAVTAFVVKSVSDFQSLVLSIGKFSDATGLSIEDASRLVEVAGDIGIEMGTLEKSLGFMNKTLGNNVDAFKELGIQIAYTSGGAIDANKTFLNVIDRLNKIEDPAVRAAAGAKLLGRGWQEMAELIGMGSAELTKSLNEVESTKVFNEEQVQNAKDLRDSFDILKGKVEGFANALGDRLVPVLTDAVNIANSLFDVFETKMPLIGGTIGSRFADAIEWTLFRPIKLGSMAVDFLSDAFGRNEQSVRNVIPPTAEMARVWEEGYTAMINGRMASDELGRALQRQKWDLEQAKTAWDIYKGALNFKAEMSDIKSDIEDFRTRWAKATSEGKYNAQEYQTELMRLQIRVANIASEVANTATRAAQNRIKILVDTGQLEKALVLLEALKSGQGLRPEYGPENIPIPPVVVARAFGGIIREPEFAMIGEAGPEVVIPLTKPQRAMNLMQESGLSQMILNQIPTAPQGGGATVVNIKVDAGLVSSPDQVGQQIIEAIRRAERRSGQVFVGV